jgi:hypothetical protein
VVGVGTTRDGTVAVGVGTALAGTAVVGVGTALAGAVAVGVGTAAAAAGFAGGVGDVACVAGGGDFVRVVRDAEFAQAAERRGVSAPSLTRAVQKLDRVLVC